MPTTATLPETMHAVRTHGPNDLRVDRIPVPTLGAGDALVRVVAAGVCATDRKLRSRGAPGVTPRVLGHEIVGEVVHAGSAGPSDGERVAVAPNLGCGNCAACRRGATNLCPDYRAFGIHVDGGMATYLHVPRKALEAGHLLPIPDACSDLDAALLEPLACCLEGLDASGFCPGDSLLVIAAGVMGRLHVAAARALGAGSIIVVDRNERRLQHARALGADVAVVPDDDLERRVLDATGGAGVNAAAVTIGDPAATESALRCLAREGRLNLFAGFGAEGGGVRIDANDVHYRALRITGTTGASKATFARALSLLAGGRVPLTGMVSGTFDLADAAEAFDAAGEPGHARVVLVPGAGDAS